LVGSVSDVIGRRYFLIVGQLSGLLGAILGATSKDINMLIGATVFIGIAAAIQLSYPLLVMEIIPNKYRGWGQGMITLLVLPSLGFGPIVGRTIVENVTGGWRYISQSWICILRC
jgi:MFS family permease